MKYAVGFNMVSFGCRMTLFKRCKSWLGRFVRSKYEEDECYDVNNAQSLHNIYGFLILDRIGRVLRYHLKTREGLQFQFLYTLHLQLRSFWNSRSEVLRWLTIVHWTKHFPIQIERWGLSVELELNVPKVWPLGIVTTLPQPWKKTSHQHQLYLPVPLLMHAPPISNTKGHFTHEPRAMTMESWEPKRKCAKAVPTHLQAHVARSQTLKCSVKPYVTGPSPNAISIEFLFHAGLHT